MVPKDKAGHNYFGKTSTLRPYWRWELKHLLSTKYIYSHGRAVLASPR